MPLEARRIFCNHEECTIATSRQIKKKDNDPTKEDSMTFQAKSVSLHYICIGVLRCHEQSKEITNSWCGGQKHIET